MYRYDIGVIIGVLIGYTNRKAFSARIYFC